MSNSEMGMTTPEKGSDGGKEGVEEEEEEEEEGSENGDVVVDLGAVPLGDALGDPHDVPAFLLLQLDVGVEDAKVELVEEGQLVELDLQGAHTGNTVKDQNLQTSKAVITQSAAKNVQASRLHSKSMGKRKVTAHVSGIRVEALQRLLSTFCCWRLTSCSKKRSSRVLSPGLLPAPSNSSLYSWRWRVKSH